MTTSRKSIARTGIALVLAAVVGSTAACGTGTSDHAASTSPKPTASASTAPTSATDGWQTLALKGGQLQVPADWTIVSGVGKSADAPLDPAYELTPVHVNFVSVPDVSPVKHSGVNLGFVELAAKDEVRTMKEDDYTGVKRLPNVVLGGVTFCHVYGETENNWEDRYRTSYDGAILSLSWVIDKTVNQRAQSEKWMNQINATFKAE